MDSKCVYLLGAGASVDAGVPASLRLTDALLQDARSGGEHDIASMLEYVRSALAHHQVRLATEQRLRQPARRRFADSDNHARPGVDIELLLRAIDQLSHRDQLEIRPFIAAWDATLGLLDGPSSVGDAAAGAVQALVRATGQQIVRSVGSTSRGGADERDLEDAFNPRPPASSKSPARAVSDHVRNVLAEAGEALADASSFEFTQAGHALAGSILTANLAGEGRAFVEARRSLERLLRGRVWLDDPKRVEYLCPLFGSGPAVIASLNYDNCVELAARACDRRVSFGVEEVDTSPAGTPESDAEVLLLKLHGSANWSLAQGHVGPADAVPQNDIKCIPDEEVRSSRAKGALIFGQEHKLSASRPYFDLFLKFRDALAEATELRVIGYSWRDEHVNSVVERWLAKSDGTRKLTIVDCGWRELSTPFKRELELLRGSPITVIEKTAAEAIPDLVQS